MWPPVGWLSVGLWDQQRLWRHDGKTARRLCTPRKRRSGSNRKGEPPELSRPGHLCEHLSFRPKQHASIVANSFRQAQRKPTTTILRYVRERGLARMPAGKGKKEAVTRARVALRAYSVPARRTRA